MILQHKMQERKNRSENLGLHKESNLSYQAFRERDYLMEACLRNL